MVDGVDSEQAIFEESGTSHTTSSHTAISPLAFTARKTRETPRQSPDGVDPDRLKDMALEALVSDMAQTCPGCHGRISVTKHPPESTSKGSDQRRRISVKDDPGLTS